MVHYAPVSGQHLGSLDPFVLGEICGNINVFVIILTAAAYGEFGNRKYDVWLDVPADRKYRSRR